MPVYVVHGFRWPRPLVRIHIILNNIDDAAAEWIMSPTTSAALKDNFATLHPSIMADLPKLDFVEQYDPDDVSSEAARSQPYAYVADMVQEVRLGVEIDEVRGQGISNDSWGAMVELRDKLAPGEKIAWFIVVCGDTERAFPPTVQLLEDGGARWRRSSVSAKEAMVPLDGAGTANGRSAGNEKAVKKERPMSKFVKFFSSRSGGDKELKRQKSNKTINGQYKAQQKQQQPLNIPPLPQNLKHHHPVQPITAPQHAHSTSNPSQPTTSSTHAHPHQHQHIQTNHALPPRAGILPSPPHTAGLSPRPPSTSHQHQHQPTPNIAVFADRPATAGAEPRAPQQLFQTVGVPTGGAERVVRPTVGSG